MQLPLLRKAIRFGKGKLVTKSDHLVKGKCTLKNMSNVVSSKSELVYKNGNHRIKTIVSKLSGDTETNPGPCVVDASKTISAPYSQGNSLVFGANAGKQCVAMSLMAIVYDWMYSITSSSDLVEIMNVGNQLYTHLSQLAQQDFLMLSELPQELCLRENRYRVQYSDSYFGNMHNSMYDSSIADDYCVPLVEAFHVLLAQNFKSFILTISLSTVGIFQTKDETFKVFDAHSRVSQGMFDACGTCVLLEIDSVGKLVEYFENLYFGVQDVLYEIKGL